MLKIQVGNNLMERRKIMFPDWTKSPTEISLRKNYLNKPPRVHFQNLGYL